ncbi:hypothetical protein KM043_000022 [Ampulex compressa]|nr:hypothetical protein KM043_000022 [Ampulex compressa]
MRAAEREARRPRLPRANLASQLGAGSARIREFPFQARSRASREGREDGKGADLREYRSLELAIKTGWKNDFLVGGREEALDPERKERDPADETRGWSEEGW